MIEKRTLPNGLTLRGATEADIENLVAFHERVQQEGEWTRILADGSHPTTSWREFTVVESPGEPGRILSSMCMIPQTWVYGSVPFGAARMEMVSTDEDFRWQGLARAQFDALQETCARRDIPVQVVVGRPFVYKRLGYSMALRYWSLVDAPRRLTPALGDGKSEPYVFRPGTPDDLPFFTELAQAGWSRCLVRAVRGVEHWRHEFFERKVANDMRLRLRILVEAAGGRPVGAVVHGPGNDDGKLDVYTCELIPEVPWPAAYPSILRGIMAAGEDQAAAEGAQFEGASLRLGTEHPMYDLLGRLERELSPESPFAWYVRVADLPAFIRRIAPVLEERLARSAMAGFSGNVKLSFYTRESGFCLAFASGRLITVEKNISQEWWEQAMPRESFLKILFGYRSLEEIEAETAEVFVRGQLRILLQVLFPKQASCIFSVC